MGILVCTLICWGHKTDRSSSKATSLYICIAEVHPIFDALGDDRRRLRSEEEQEVRVVKTSVNSISDEVRVVKTSMHPILDERPLGDEGNASWALALGSVATEANACVAKPEQERVKAFAKMYTCIHLVAYPTTWKTVNCIHCTHLADLPPHENNCNLYTLYTFKMRHPILSNRVPL